MTNPFVHEPVLIEEVVQLLAGCHRVLDGTAGGGGHARRLADAGASVVAIDRDPAAVAAAAAVLGERGSVRLLDFAEAAADAALRAFGPDGILLDLGVSSPQLDEQDRGFTFRPGALLDMRMAGDREPGTGTRERTAADWLNSAPVEEIAEVFHRYGDEPRARRLAGEVARRRATRPFKVSDDLVGAIRAVLGPRSGPAEFARLFQAVRIAVNQELERLERALPALLGLLAGEGVLAVISYHSGEDRIVKHLFREWARRCVCPPEQPVCTCRARALGVVLTRKPVEPNAVEVARNPRARSARLRAFRKAAG